VKWDFRPIDGDREVWTGAKSGNSFQSCRARLVWREGVLFLE